MMLKKARQAERKARAARLKQARVDAGYQSARQAAIQNGWKIVTYNVHENGRAGFENHHGRNYAAAFGVNLDWLMLGTEKEENSTGSSTVPPSSRIDDAHGAAQGPDQGRDGGAGNADRRGLLADRMAAAIEPILDIVGPAEEADPVLVILYREAGGKAVLDVGRVGERRKSETSWHGRDAGTAAATPSSRKRRSCADRSGVNPFMVRRRTARDVFELTLIAATGGATIVLAALAAASVWGA